MNHQSLVSNPAHGDVITELINSIPDLALSMLPLVLFILIFYFIFRRKFAELQTKLSATNINNPQGAAQRHNCMANCTFGWSDSLQRISSVPFLTTIDATKRISLQA